MLAAKDRLFIALATWDHSLENMLFSNQDTSPAGRSLHTAKTALHVCTLARKSYCQSVGQPAMQCAGQAASAASHLCPLSHGKCQIVENQERELTDMPIPICLLWSLVPCFLTIGGSSACICFFCLLFPLHIKKKCEFSVRNWLHLI